MHVLEFEAARQRCLEDQRLAGRARLVRALRARRRAELAARRADRAVRRLEEARAAVQPAGA